MAPMLPLVAAALAGPLSPAAAQAVGVGLEIAGVVATERESLVVPDCDGDACRAVRAEVLQGAEVDLRLSKHFGLYVQGGRVIERTAAATYEGVGWGVGGGIKGGAELKSGFGVDGWGAVAVRSTRDPFPEEGEAPDTSNRTQVTLGGDVRWGTARDGFMGWAGAEVTPISAGRTLVLDATLPVQLRPQFPVSAVLGIQAMSEPLSGPWAERGRIGAGVTATAGFRTGVTGWLLVAM